MKNLLTSILASTVLIACNDNANENANINRELLSEPAAQEKLNHLEEKAIRSGCGFDNPDSSLSGIILRDVASAEKVIGNNNVADSAHQYHFYTKNDRETLTLTQYRGSLKNVISVIKAEYSDKADHGYKQLAVDTLVTEKAIKLGMTQNEVIAKLGTCHTALYNGKNSVQLNYLLESPSDSKTGLLKRQNMRAYFASYRFRNNKLETMEFGFKL